MTRLFDKAIRAGAKIATALARFRERRLGRFEALKQKRMEAERLDRLRNPGNYQGR